MAYIDFSMSERAAEAYRRGLRPASKIGHGIPAHLIEEYVRPVEWHHCSKMYNEVNFYDPQKVLATFGLIEHPDFEPDPEAIEALARWREEKSQTKIYENCTVEWLEWSGRFANPWRDAEWKATKKSAMGCRVTVKGRMATIEFPDGKIMRKRIGTKGFSFTPRQQPAMSHSKNGELANICEA